jgi:lipid-binding SYLF domain-containing protein
MRNLTAAMIAIALAACATAPKSPSGRQELVQSANATVQQMVRKDPSLQDTLNRSAGYAVFPNIGKGGFIAGAAHGKGVLYERGQPVGFVSVTQGSVGAQIGAQTYTELIVFADPARVQQVKGGQFQLGGNASAVVLTAGAAASTGFTDGIAVFVQPKGGAMAELSVSGQQINFTPISG